MPEISVSCDDADEDLNEPEAASGRRKMNSLNVKQKPEYGNNGMLQKSLVKSPFVFGLVTVIQFVAVSCSKATFTGSNPGRGNESDPTVSAPLEPAPPSPTEEGEAVVVTDLEQAPPAPTGQPVPVTEIPPSSTEVPPPVAEQEAPKAPEGIASVPQEVPQCTPKEKMTGTRMVMVIDNSNSNAETDCPAPFQSGEFRGTKLYKCADQTSRSKAAMAVYDLLKSAADKDPANPLAKSQLAVSYFPTREDYVSGFKIEKEFTETTLQNRAGFLSSLAFTQEPYGMTPYVAAMTSVESLFKTDASDGRSKVVLFVTDGEATDRDPIQAITKAEALMGAGVQVMTVYYPTKDSRSERVVKHTAMMKDIDDNYVALGGGHWYDDSRYKSFEDYIKTIVGDVALGGTPQASTLLKITTKVNPACIDGSSLCERKSYEVANASALADAVGQIVKREVLGCDPK